MSERRPNAFKKSGTSKTKFQYLPGISAHAFDAQTIIFSAPFRRLLDKAQVFPLEKYDYVRTRLTHSIEVMNIADSITTKICYNLKNLNPINFVSGP